MCAFYDSAELQVFPQDVQLTNCMASNLHLVRLHKRVVYRDWLKGGMWFGEICSCFCLPALLGPVWVLLHKICIPFTDLCTEYIPTKQYATEQWSIGHFTCISLSWYTSVWCLSDEQHQKGDVQVVQYDKESCLIVNMMVIKMVWPILSTQKQFLSFLETQILKEDWLRWGICC